MTEFLSKKELPNKWLYDYFNPFEVHKHAIKGTLYHGNSDVQEIVIAESQNFGRCLILDNEFQSAELDEFIYHESLVHPALMLHPKPEKVAIIGGGEGAALREVLRHKSVRKAVMIDIDRKVVDCAREFLPSYHNGAFDDARAELRYEDGRKFIENSKDSFDIIIVDLTCPLEGGPSYKLFTREFYSIAKDRLTAQGILAVQADNTSPVASYTYTVIARTLREVFPGVFPYAAYVPSYAMLWGFCLGTNGPDPVALAKEEIDRRISQRVEGELGFYDGLTHQGIFSLPKYLRKALEEQTDVNTDSKPIMERYPGFRVE
ncbi:MAG: polyamine aminopropyltransferase [Candidatus Brocadiales bacterium]